MKPEDPTKRLPRSGLERREDIDTERERESRYDQSLWNGVIKQSDRFKEVYGISMKDAIGQEDGKALRDCIVSVFKSCLYYDDRFVGLKETANDLAVQEVCVMIMRDVLASFGTDDIHNADDLRKFLVDAPKKLLQEFSDKGLTLKDIGTEHNKVIFNALRQAHDEFKPSISRPSP
jgi:hypothetical protein